MGVLQTIIFVVIQGITELFPISSVAHGVLTPYVFHWNLDDQILKEHFLPYVVMLNLGTAVALLIYFRSEWLKLLSSLVVPGDKPSKQIICKLLVATIPAAVIGAVLEKPFRHVFSSVAMTAIFLIVNGVILFMGEKSAQRGTKDLHEISLKQAFIVGIFQSLALIPGFSRSGASTTAGFWVGLKHEAAAKFSMLLSTPIILGASVLEVPKLLKSGVGGLLHSPCYPTI